MGGKQREAIRVLWGLKQQTKTVEIIWLYSRPSVCVTNQLSMALAQTVKDVAKLSSHRKHTRIALEQLVFLHRKQKNIEIIQFQWHLKVFS